MKGKWVNIFSIIILGVALLSFSEAASLKVTKTNLFKVIKVNGKILFIKTGKNLRTGDAYIDGTPLSFASNKDRAAVVNKIRGRYILQANPKGKAIVLPATSNIGARGNGSTVLNALDFKNYFSDTAVFIGDVNVRMGKEAFPMDDDHFFYATYVYKGEKIAKKINFSGQELKISESKLFEIDGESIPTFSTRMTLYYMKGEKARKMSEFYPVFPSQTVLKDEISVLLDELKELKTDKKLDEVATYISEFYGRPQKENLNDWLFETFGIGIQKETNFK